MSIDPTALREIEFTPHHLLEYCLSYSFDEKKWVIRNKIGLYLTYDNLHRAMGDMYCMTDIPSDDWSCISAYPYGV